MKATWPSFHLIIILLNFSALVLVPHGASSAEPEAKATAAYRVFATQLDEPRGLLIAPDGAMYVAEQKSGAIARIGTDGKVQRIAHGFQSPHDLDLDAAGDLYVADTGAGRVAKIAPSGAVTTFIDDLESPVDLAFTPDGELWVCELTGKVRAFKLQGGSRVVAELGGPHGLAFAKSGTIYINDWRGNRVIKVEGGRIRPFASLPGPVGIAIGPSGDIYVAQPQAHRVSRIKTDGTVSTFAINLNEPRDPVFDRRANLYIAETLSGRILVYAGDL